MSTNFLQMLKILKENSLLAQGVTQDEMRDLKNIDNTSMINQARLDIGLHKSAIGDRDRFDSQDDQYLKNDINTKKRFINILKNNINDKKEIQDVINLLTKDMSTHYQYIKNPSKEMGSAGWHQTWINVYQNWINHLNKLL